MLQRFDERAPAYDRENRFFSEDFEELRASGYLSAPLPDRLRRRRARPGRGQPRCSAGSPTTRRRPRRRQHAPLLGRAGRRPAPAGDPPATGSSRRRPPAHVLAAGHGEAGNDLPLLLSSSQAERVDGGWEFTGHKIFGSLSPVWDLPRRARHGHQRPRQPAGRARLPAPRRLRLPHRGDVGHARHAGDRVQRHDPRRHVHPRRAGRPGLPGRVRRRRAVPRRAVRVGPARVRRPSTRASPSGLRRRPWPASTGAPRSR